MKVDNLTKEAILSFLREHKLFFKKEFNIDNIILFGSYARDEATKDSDIDILIEAKEKDFDKKFDLRDFLEKHS